MAQGMNRDNPRYIRILELLSVISEEWGEAIQASNNHIWKGESIDLILEELNDIKSPLLEFEELLKLMKLQESNEK